MNQDRHNEPYQSHPPSYNTPEDMVHRQNMNPHGAGQTPYEWNFEAMYQNSNVPPRRNKGLKVFLATACTLAMIVVLGFAGYGVYELLNINDAGTVQGIVTSDRVENSLPNINTNNAKPNLDGHAGFIDDGYSNNELYKMVSPSVVGIVTQGGEGSGIVLSEDGYIVTNAHVVEGAINGIQVAITSGDEIEYYDAKLVGSDRQTDIAVVKVNNVKLKPAEFGRSSDLEIGERVIAIGNPGGVQFASSLSVGWVSGLNRMLSDKELGFSLAVIQVNAAINPGNSGGALVNRYGQVVGINSSKINAVEYEGMGFAIPIDDAMPIVEDLIKYGKVTGRAMLGIMATEVNAFAARFNGLRMGIQVKDTTDNPSLTEAGILPGDIIVSIGGKEVTTLGEVASVLKKYKPGDRVDVEVYRPSGQTFNRGETFKATITLVGS